MDIIKQSRMRTVIKKLISYFFQGLLYVVPVALTIYILFKIFLVLDGIIEFEKIPGLGLLVLVAGITLMGYIGTLYFMHPVYSLMEHLIGRAPLIKVIYTSVKDLIQAFVGEKKRFTKPVLVTMDKEAGVQRIGFITQSDLTNLGISADKVAVYFPFPYSFMGNLAIVPKENITLLDTSGTEMMKFIVSGGVTELSEQKEGKEKL